MVQNYYMKNNTRLKKGRQKKILNNHERRSTLKKGTILANLAVNLFVLVDS